MPNPMLAMMGVSAGASILGSREQANAAQDASDAQVQAARMGINEQRRQFNTIQKLYRPYIGAGSKALGGLLDLNGLHGDKRQQGAIDDIANSSQFTALRDQGFNAINQNAAATGGLRGGNNQAALAQFAPNMLQSLIEQQYSQLGGIATMGQNSAANQATAGQNFANAASGGYGQIGAAEAGADIATGGARSSMWGGLGGALNYGFGNAMQPAQLSTPSGMQPNPAAMQGGLFSSWGWGKGGI